MRPSKAALLSLAVSPTAAWNHLSASGFREALKNGHSLVAFVDPSLESCKQLHVEWTAVQAQTEKAQAGHTVASVDCAQETQLCDDLDVASYPAIRLFYSDGRVRRYRGRRRSSDIVAFLRRSLRPTLSHVDDRNATAFSAIDDVVFIANYGSGTDLDHALPDRFAKLSQTYSDRYSFAVSVVSSTPAAPSLTCYNTQDNEQHTAGDLSAVATLDAFVSLCATPVVADLTRRNELQLFNAGKSLVHYFYRSEDERRGYVAAVRQLAKTYREYLSFTTIDANEYGDDMMGPLGLAATGPAPNRPPLAVQNPSNGDVFPYTGSEEISHAAVERFLLDIIQGAVKPWAPGAPKGNAHDEL